MVLRYRGSRSSGFTIIELLVTIAIIGILTVLMIANYRDFERRNVLDNIAQDISLSVRLAQSYGLNVRGFGGADEFDMSYGIHFDSSTPSEYFIYRDPDLGRSAEFDGNSIEVERFTLNNGYRLSNVCLIAGATSDCWGGGNDIDISFTRPKPDAYFFLNGSYNAAYSQAVITLEDVNGFTKDVSVQITGYISAQ